MPYAGEYRVRRIEKPPRPPPAFLQYEASLAIFYGEGFRLHTNLQCDPDSVVQDFTCIVEFITGMQGYAEDEQ